MENNKLNLLEMINTEKHLEERLGDVLFKDFASLKDFKSIKNTPIGKSLLDMEKAIGLQSNPIKIGKNQLSTAEDIFNAVKNGSLQGKELGRVGKGLLKSPNTPSSVRISLINDFIVDATVIKELNGKNVSEIKKLLKSKGYADESINEIIKQSKNRGLINSEGKFVGKTKSGTGTPPPGTPPKPSSIVAALKKLPKNIKDGIMNLLRAKKGWKVIVKYILLAGVPLSVAWYFLKDSGEELPSDFPDNVPQDFPPCVQDLIRNKQGEVMSVSTGGSVIFVKSNEYPEGIQFYPNGRVLDIKTGKKGTYKCKGEKVKTIPESFTLNEQSEEEVAKDVDTMIDLLDFPVSQNDMLKASSMLEKYKNSGKGKEFLSLYKQSGLGGGSLKKSIDYIYTTDARSVQIKNKLYSLINQIESGTTGGSTQTSSGDLSGIDITWDTKTSTGGGGTTKVQYKDKSDFPFPRGTRNEKIREVQKCLNFPAKLQTGNFGPITYKALVSFIKDSANYKFGLTGGFNIYIEELNTTGLTKDLYDIIMKACGKVSTTGDTSTTTGGQTTTGTATTGGETTTGTTTTGDTSTTTGGQTTNETPSDVYVRLFPQLKPRKNLKGEIVRVVYKGEDLTDDVRNKLTEYMGKLGYYLSREDRDYRQGEKVVYRKNKPTETK